MTAAARFSFSYGRLDHTGSGFTAVNVPSAPRRRHRHVHRQPRPTRHWHGLVVDDNAAARINFTGQPGARYHEPATASTLTTGPAPTDQLQSARRRQRSRRQQPHHRRRLRSPPAAAPSLSGGGNTITSTAAPRSADGVAVGASASRSPRATHRPGRDHRRPSTPATGTGTITIGTGRWPAHRQRRRYQQHGRPSPSPTGNISATDGTAEQHRQSTSTAATATSPSAPRSPNTSGGDVVEITGRTGGTISFHRHHQRQRRRQRHRHRRQHRRHHQFHRPTTLAPAPHAVDLTGNAGATINFNAGGNGLDITTTTGTGFNATGAARSPPRRHGHVQGTGQHHQLDAPAPRSTSPTPPSAPSDLTFQSISSNGAANGIVLNNTARRRAAGLTSPATTAPAATVRAARSQARPGPESP